MGVGTPTLKLPLCIQLLRKITLFAYIHCLYKHKSWLKTKGYTVAALFNSFELIKMKALVVILCLVTLVKCDTYYTISDTLKVKICSIILLECL